MSAIDTPRAVRPGEELDCRQVERYLKGALPGLTGEVQVRQFPSGYSNLTYMVSVGDRELILRRPPFGTKAKSAHDMKREYTILKALKPHFRYVPEPLAYCEDLEILGAPFYVMERIKGIILRRDFPKGLALDAKAVGRLCENLMAVFSELHGLDYRQCGLESLGKPEGYVKRQVSGWAQRYRDARTDDVPDFEAVIGWLEAHIPAETGHAAIIHNDFKFDNVVLNPENPLEIIGVVDWEMATLGDPLMDLGASMAYWVDRSDPPEMELIRTLPTTAPGMLSRREMVALYAKASGCGIGGFGFYYGFGLFRLAVIAQQIYYRYVHGQTRDERFKRLGQVVGLLERACLKVMADGGC